MQRLQSQMILLFNIQIGRTEGSNMCFDDRHKKTEAKT